MHGALRQKRDSRRGPVQDDRGTRGAQREAAIRTGIQTGGGGDFFFIFSIHPHSFRDNSSARYYTQRTRVIEIDIITRACRTIRSSCDFVFFLLKFLSDLFDRERHGERAERI